MAKIKKVIENGGIQYPATITDAVKNPNNGKTVTEELSELGSNISKNIFVISNMTTNIDGDVLSIIPSNESDILYTVIPRGAIGIKIQIDAMFLHYYFFSEVDYRNWNSNTYIKYREPFADKVVGIKEGSKVCAINIPHNEYTLSNIKIEYSYENNRIISIHPSKTTNLDSNGISITSSNEYDIVCIETPINAEGMMLNENFGYYYFFSDTDIKNFNNDTFISPRIAKGEGYATIPNGARACVVSLAKEEYPNGYGNIKPLFKTVDVVGVYNAIKRNNKLHGEIVFSEKDFLLKRTWNDNETSAVNNYRLSTPLIEVINPYIRIQCNSVDGYSYYLSAYKDGNRVQYYTNKTDIGEYKLDCDAIAVSIRSIDGREVLQEDIVNCGLKIEVLEPCLVPIYNAKSDVVDLQERIKELNKPKDFYLLENHTTSLGSDGSMIISPNSKYDIVYIPIPYNTNLLRVIGQPTGNYYFFSTTNYDDWGTDTFISPRIAISENYVTVPDGAKVCVVNMVKSSYPSGYGDVFFELKSQEKESGSLPIWYDGYIDKKIEELQEAILLSDRGDSFGFVTDTHPHNSASAYNIRSGAIFKHFLTNTLMNKVFFGGDIGANNASSFGEGTTAKEAIVKGMIEQVKVLISPVKSSGGKYYAARGNHDFSIRMYPTSVDNDEGYQLSDLQTKHSLIDSSYREVITDAQNESATYYYFDNILQNIRYVFLDTSDTDYGYYGDSNVRIGVSDRQLQWFVEEAILKASEGMSIVVVLHISPYIASDSILNGTDYKDVMKIGDIISSVQRKESLSVSGKIYDFTEAKCNVSFVLAGHLHRDMQTCIDGVWSFSQGGDVPTESVKNSPLEKLMGVEIPSRSANSIYEDELSVTNINLTDSIIKNIRVGVGVNRMFHVQQRIVSSNSTLQFDSQLNGEIKWACYDADKKSGSGDSVEYVSSYATISDSGMLTASSQGQVVVAAYSKDDNYFEMWSVKIE